MFLKMHLELKKLKNFWIDVIMCIFSIVTFNRLQNVFRNNVMP